MKSVCSNLFIWTTVKGSEISVKGCLTLPPNLTRALVKAALSSSYPAGVSGRVLYLTRFFLLLLLLLLLSSSGNTSKTHSFDMPWPISTKLGHKNPWPMAFMSYNENGVKGHVGVTGVKKVKNSKNATPPTDYRVWSRDSCICISFTPATKVITLKIHSGSFGVTGVKRPSSLKML